MNLVAEQLNNDLSQIEHYESSFNEGDKGEIRFYFDRNLTWDEIDQLEQEIIGQEVVLTAPVRHDARIVSIRFQKAIAPLLIIALAIAGIGASLLGWQLWTEPLGVPWWVWITGGAAVLYLLFREPAKKAGGLAIQAGKVYVTKGMLK